MDERLLAWGRAVKQRRRSGYPVLWLFTDARRLADPLPAIAKLAAGLPAGSFGVVFRHDGAADRVKLARRVARLCKARRVKLVVAGDARLAAAVGAGLHLRGGRWTGAGPGQIRGGRGLVTASAHDVIELRRARLAGARIIFLSPVFVTESHSKQAALGVMRWANIARQGGGVEVYALGGITGETVTMLPRFCGGLGAIGSLSLNFT